MVCDLQELYRYLIDDFLIGYCQRINKQDFAVKVEAVNRARWVLRVADAYLVKTMLRV